MTLNRILSAVTLSAALVSTSALAQTRFCLGGDLDHLSQKERAACAAKMQSVRVLAASLHAPENWHFVMVCGEEGWKQYVAYAEPQGKTLLEASYNTDYLSRETFLRETRLADPDSPALRQIIARELSEVLAHQNQRTDATASLNGITQTLSGTGAL